MAWTHRAARHLAAATLLALAPLAPPQAAQIFADEDRSAELAGQPAHQRYQFNSPTTVTYDRDTLAQGRAGARVYVADMGSHRIRVLDLDGRTLGMLDDADQALAPDSPASAVPQIRAPLGIAFLSRSEAVDDRLAGLYVNDVGRHQIHFFRTVDTDPDAFAYVASFGIKGTGGGAELTLPRNLVVTPQGHAYVSDEFNHRIKVFRLDPDQGYQATLVQTLGVQDGAGHPVGAGPILRGVDKDYGTPSANYDDYASAPDKRDGWRIPQGLTYFRAPGGATFVYVADNGNNRIKIFQAAADGSLTLLDMLGRFRAPDGGVDHLKRPRGLRTDAQGNLYVADTYNGRILVFPNLAQVNDAQPVRYRSSGSADAQARWMYGRLGIHQVEMRLPATAGTEDAAFQLPNDLVPVVGPDGEFHRENIWAWGAYYSNARVHLVSDTGNHRIKKCWTNSAGTTLLRCSVSQGVGLATAHEFWGHPRTLAGQLHSASGMVWLAGSNRLLVSDTPNTRINVYDAFGAYQGRFGGTDISIGVTGLARFQDGGFGESVAVLVGADATLPWPYTGNSSLRIYDAGGSLRHIFNLSTRTTGLSVPSIGVGTANYPVAVSVRTSASNAARQHAIYVTSFAERLWRFDYNAASGTLSRIWHTGGADASKGTDVGSSWSLGPNFYGQGAPGTFDQIGAVHAGAQRIYVTDRRNQRVQAFAPTTGSRLGQFGEGGGTYDHPDGLDPQRLFLPAGLAFDAGRGSFLVADGFNMVARAWADPDASPVGANGRIAPAYQGHWLDPDLGTRPGGLFDAELVAPAGDAVYVFSLISNRVTRFDWNEIAP